MDSSMGDSIAKTFLGWVAIMLGLAFGAGLFCMWLLPKLWHWLKPLINHATQ